MAKQKKPRSASRPVEESPASLFVDRAVEAVVVLPVPIHGRQAAVRVRMIEPWEMTVATEGVPEIVKRVGGEKKAKALPPKAAAREAVLPMREIARAGIVSPVFAFDAPVKGRPYWGALHWHNKVAIVKGICGLSGVGEVPDDLVTFPDVGAEGLGDGRGDRGDRTARGKAADRGHGAADGGAAAQRGDPPGVTVRGRGVRQTSAARRSRG